MTQRIERAGRLALGALALFVFWILLSGKLDAFHLGLGLVSAVSVALSTGKLLRPAPAPDGKRFSGAVTRTVRFVGYGFWLLAEIFVSAAAIAWLVLHPRLPARPRLVRITDGLPHRMARLTLAHSITLTPGTVTVECDEDGMVIHAMDESAASSMGANGGPMAARVRRLFWSPSPPPSSP